MGGSTIAYHQQRGIKHMWSFRVSLQKVVCVHPYCAAQRYHVLEK